jgi:hypothetical protein
MIRHLNTLKNEDWFYRPWILLGTGPSLDNFVFNDWKDHNIVAIYDAYFACDYVDVLFVSDRWDDPVYGNNHYWRNDNIKFVATRNENIIRIGEQKNIVMWDYDCDERRIFYDQDRYPCSNTSSLAVLWLGTMGVKEIKTFGIDGGKGVSKYVSEEYRKGLDTLPGGIDYDFTHENGGVFGHANILEINLIKQ